MFYNKDCDQLIVVRTAPGYTAVQETLKSIDENLSSLNDDNQKVVIPTMCNINFGTKDNDKNGFQWTDRWITFSAAANKAGKECYEAFAEFAKGCDKEELEKLNVWLSASDSDTKKLQKALETANG